MSRDIRLYLTRAHRCSAAPSSSGMSPATAESSGDELAVVENDIVARPKKRPIGIFSHVAIPVRPKRLKSSAVTFEQELAPVALPTPQESSSDETARAVRPLPRRTCNRRVSYAEPLLVSSDDNPEISSEDDYRKAEDSDYEEVPCALDADEYEKDPIAITSSEPESDPSLDELEVMDEDTDSMGVEEPKIPATDHASQGRRKSSSNGRGKRSAIDRGIDISLPPLSNIHEIFRDITEKALRKGLHKTLQALSGQELRIATMCSGTESPLLALQLVAEALEQFGAAPLRLRHVFSAEIVPKKQAYIERNFHPPIIFRDIRELTKEDAFEAGATNVYGAKVPIPGNIHLLVAGFSCVDFSALNNKGKTLNEKGESRDTLEAILSYAKKWKPKLIILENVMGAPWPKCIERAKKVGYAADWVKADTKDYYIPHTRNRGYMVCIHEEQFPGDATAAVLQWKKVMMDFRRRASAPASAFLLPADDHRVYHFNAQLSAQSRHDGRERTVNWDACRQRHQRVRRDDRLGTQRPITNWIDNGTCLAFEHAHKKWLAKQVERVWDCIEIRFLRVAKDNHSAGIRGYDIMYKTSIMELSQNVDRFAQEMPFGICSCITPSGIFFLTDRGGPLTPYETLALQGLPLDKISFTIETLRELQDLAGNAMSSTVVGVAQLAALIVAPQMLKQHTPHPEPITTILHKGTTICGEKLLQQTSEQDIDPLKNLSLYHLCEDASQSIRLCRCEGQFGTTDKEVLVCKKCAHTVCAGCKSKPAHLYSTNLFKRTLTAHEFELRWKRVFPASLYLTTKADMSELLEGCQLAPNCSKPYFDAVAGAFNELFKFQHFKRTSKWAIRYESSKAVLQLEIARKAEWRLWVKTPANLAGNDPLRIMLQSPVARANMPEAFDFGKGSTSTTWAEQWEWFVPFNDIFPVSIKEASSETNSSWRALYGLIDYEDEKVPRTMHISMSASNAAHFHEDISGIYEHLPVCGTACSALYRRISFLNKPSTTCHPVDDEPSPLYLFLDPSRIGPVNEDSFVFSRYHERLEYDEERDIIVKLDPSFRPWNRASFQTQGSLRGFWAPEKSTTTILCAPKNNLILNRPGNDPAWGNNIVYACSQSLAVLSLKFHVEGHSGGVVQHRFDEQGKISFMNNFSWILGTNAHLPNLKAWRPLDVGSTSGICSTCAPTPPSIKWAQTETGRKKSKPALVAQEDPREAARYERGMKSRPMILDMTAVVDTSSDCHLRIGLNVVSLAHRALSHLPASQGKPTVSWNLTTEYVPPSTPSLPPFRLISNFEDPEHDQPRGFLLNLRPAQRRSLFWMRKQEQGARFTIQEVAEEVVEPIRWKIEAKAEMDISIKGGVVADQVSYGKTITSLALIHQSFRDKPDPSPPNNGMGLIPLKATLILVPNNLPNQWKQEAMKCLPRAEYSSQEILMIKTSKDLDETRIEDLIRAKIVIVPFNLLGKDSYTDRLARFTALPETPSNDGRQYEAWFNYALRRIPEMNEKLKELGISSFEKLLDEELERIRHHEDFTSIIPSKRTKGSKYKSFEELSVESRVTTKPIVRKTAPAPLKTGVARSDWSRMRSPVLHQFKFNRLIIDEFHYPRGREYTSLVTLSADRRWILSGTPPLDDFADVKRFAAFLGVNLGIDWDAPGVITQENSKQMRKEKTSFELFQTFSERRSPTWHERRHAHAQAFLDAFARQNSADIGEVKCYEALRPVELTLDHRAIYEELLMHLKGWNMAMPKLSGSEAGDRALRLRQYVRDSTTTEEMLMHCACIETVKQGNISACQMLEKKREKELEDQRNTLRRYILRAANLARTCGNINSEWKNWIVRYKNNDLKEVEDAEVHQDIKSMIKSAEQYCTRVKDMKPSEAAVEVQKLVRFRLGTETRKLLGMHRSLRYVRSVPRLNQALLGVEAVKCERGDAMHKTAVAATAVVIGCGHVVCQACLNLAVVEERCGVSGCAMKIGEHSFLDADRLLRCKDRVPERESFGARLDAVTELLRQIPNDEQAIIFVQSYRMMSMVDQALESRGVTAYAVDRVSESASDKIDDFINNQRYMDNEKTKLNKKFGKALILNLADESASGMNLVNANHVIFISPLLTSSNQKYQAAMVQSIGRARRYGQKRPVHVYRVVAPNTVDVDILEQRELRTKALSEHMQEMEPPYDPAKKGYQKVQVVRNAYGTMMAVPKSWLGDDFEAHRDDLALGERDPERLERLNCLSSFSETYAEGGVA